MTILVTIETVILVLLAVLVAGLLRSHATILQRLHALDSGATAALDGGATAATRSYTTMPGIPAPVTLSEPQIRDPDSVRATDLVGATPDGETALVRITGVEHDTVLAFLSSGCSTCQEFWDEFDRPRAVRLPAGTRLLVVTKGEDAESPAEVARLRPRGTDVIMSSQAWVDYGVPGSPYVVAVDGATGRIKGEGTGMSWPQVAKLLAQATGDIGFLSEVDARRGKPTSDLEREARVDRELMAAGILPGDTSLYPEVGPR
jgi:hypothetical protein